MPARRAPDDQPVPGADDTVDTARRPDGRPVPLSRDPAEIPPVDDPRKARTPVDPSPPPAPDTSLQPPPGRPSGPTREGIARPAPAQRVPDLGDPAPDGSAAGTVTAPRPRLLRQRQAPREPAPRAGQPRHGDERDRSGPVWRLLWTARPRLGWLAFATLAGIAAGAATVGSAATAAWLVARAAQHPPVLALTGAFLVVRALGLARGFLRYTEQLAAHDSGLRVRGDVRTGSYTRLLRLVPGGVDLRCGDRAARFATDLDTAVDVLVRVAVRYAAGAGVAIGAVALLAHLLPATGIVLGAGVVLFGAGIRTVVAVAGRDAARHRDPLRESLAAETRVLLGHLPELVACRATGARIDTLDSIDTGLRHAESRVGAVTAAASALTAAFSAGCAALCLIAGATAAHAHHLSPTLLAVLVLTPLAVFDTLAELPDAAADLRAGRAALARVHALLGTADPTPPGAMAAEPAAYALPARPFEPPAEPVSPAVPEPDRAPTAGTSWSETAWLPAGRPRAYPVYVPSHAGRRHLRLRGVDARWRPHGPIVLSGVDLDLPPGSRTLVTGPPGSGKSTLAALLARLLDPVAGAVTLDGVDLRDLDGTEVRRAIRYVAGAYLFDTTVAGNLRIGAPGATDPEMWTALRRVRADGWVATLPGGLRTPVGAHGERTGDDQRDRLALARALLDPYPVLVFDDPASHLDGAAAEDVVAGLLHAASGRTIVIFTARPPRAARFDQVVVIDGGRAEVARPPAGG